MTVILQLIISGLLIGGIYALISLGLNLIFGVTRVVNFAHGEFLMFAMYGSYWLFKLWGIDPYVSILFVVPLLFIFGMIVQRTVIHPLLDAPHHNQIFATVGLSIIMSNAALLIWSADYRPVNTVYSSAAFNLGPLAVSMPKLVGFVLALLVTILLFLFLKHTATGRAIRATAQDKGAAQLMGVDVKKMYILAFGLGSAAVGAAGAILVPMFYTFPSVGSYFAITAFVVCVLGGLGNMTGAFLGGLLIGVVETFSGYYIDPTYKELVYFALFVIVLVFKPSGLFGLGKTE